MGNDREDRTSIGQVSDTEMKEALLSKRADLTGELKDLDAMASRLREEYSRHLERLQAEKKPLEDALHHVDALLRFEDHHAGIGSSIAGGSATPAYAASASITDAAVDLLEELHRPMHYREIAARIQESNAYIPGKDPAATLLSRMNRDSRFELTGKRGTYALSTWQAHSARPAGILIDDRAGNMEGLFKNGAPDGQATPFGQPWDQSIVTIWDLMTSGRVRNQTSLFASGMCYGAS